MKIEHRLSTSGRETHFWILGLHIELFRRSGRNEWQLAWVGLAEPGVDAELTDDTWPDGDERLRDFIRRHLIDAKARRWAGL